MRTGKAVEIARGRGEGGEAIFERQLLELGNTLVAVDIIHGKDRLALGQKVALQHGDRFPVGFERIVLVTIATEVEILDADAPDAVEVGFLPRRVVAEVVEDEGAVLGNDKEVGVRLARVFCQRHDKVYHALRGLFHPIRVAGLALALGGLRAPEVIGVHDVEIGRVEARLHDRVQIARLLVVEQQVLPVLVPVSDLARFRPIGVDRPQPVRRVGLEPAGRFACRCPVAVPVVAEFGGLSDRDIGRDNRTAAHAVLHARDIVGRKARRIRAITRRINHLQVVRGGCELPRIKG